MRLGVEPTPLIDVPLPLSRVIISLRAVLALAIACSGLSGAELYVAPVGDDANPGTKARPLATIQAGVDKLRPGDTLLILAGVYRETIIFPRSGTAEKPITVKAPNGEKVVISGGEPVDGWTLHDPSKNIWKAKMPWTLGTGRNQVFCGEEVLIEARFPNQPAPGLEMPVSGLCGLWPTFGEFAVPDPTKQPGRVVSKLLQGQPENHWKGALYYGIHHGGWSAQTGVVQSSKPGEIMVGDRTPSWWSVSSGKIADDGRGMIIGHMNALDQPGEWHWEDKTLYLIPPSGAKPSGVEGKRRQLALDLSGREHVRLEGLEIRAASMLLAESAHCVVDRCTFSYVSHYTRLYRGSQVEPGRNTMISGETGIYVSGHDNALLNSTVRRSAGAGVFLGGHRHTVHNCLIDEIDYASHYLYALHVLPAEDLLFGGHTLTYNTLRNAGRSWYGINGTAWAGASRAYRSPPTLATLFAHNHAYNGMLQTRDAGGITGGGASGGSLNGIRGQMLYNVMHDCYDPWGMEKSILGICYLDLGTCDMDISHNLLWAAPGSLQAGFWFNEACVDIRERDNVLRKEFSRSSGELRAEDFPGGKAFRFGHDFRNPPPLPKWPQLETMRREAEESSRLSGGVAKTPDGITGLKDGDWFALDKVDWSQGWQSAVLRFSCDTTEMNSDSSAQAAPRHQKTTDPLILACSRSAKEAGYDDAAPKTPRHWTFVYNLPHAGWLRFNKVPMGEGYRRFRAVYGYTGSAPAWLEVRLDRLDGPVAFRVPLPQTPKPTAGPVICGDALAELPPTLTGTHDVFLVFKTEEQDSSKKIRLDRLEYCRFEQYQGQIPLQKNEVKLEVRAGSPDGEKLGEFYPRFTGGPDQYKETATSLETNRMPDARGLFVVMRSAIKNRQDFRTNPDLEGEVRDGAFRGRIIKPSDPQLVFPRAKAPLRDNPSVRIRVKVPQPTSGVIYFGTKAEPGFSGDKKSDSFDFIGDGQWHDYTIEMRNPKWTGELNAIRIDFDRAARGAEVAVDSIRLVAGEQETVCLDFKTHKAEAPTVSVDWISLEKAKATTDSTGLGIEPLKLDGRQVFPEPTHQPLPPDTRRLPSRLRQKLEAKQKK
jgi:hypothetical protein